MSESAPLDITGRDRAYYESLPRDALVEAAVALNGLVERYETERQTDDSFRDDLTGALNRGGLRNAYERRSRAHRRQTDTRPDLVAFIDLDEFKSINDSLGHVVGDVALKTVASALTQSVRHPSVVGRYGGDEFMALLFNTTPQEGMLVADRMHQTTAAAAQLGNVTLRIPTLSIGIAEIQYSNDFDSMYHQADQALYESKHNGRNRTTLVPTILQP